MKRSFEGSIYPSKDKKTWFARLRYTDKDGVRREKKRICKTHAAAKEKIKALKVEIEVDNSDRKTFRQLDAFYRKKYLHAAKFVDGQKVSGFRQALHGINYYLDVALEHFGDRYIDSIVYADLQDYKAKVVALPAKHGGQRSFASINHFLKCLRRLFNIAVEQEWLSTNPFAKGEPLIRVAFEEQRTRILSHHEETRLLSTCSGKRRHIKPLVIFAIETGCRKNEILTLKWRNVNFEGRYIQIESQNTKTLKGRFVPISSRLSELLAELWSKSPQKLDWLVFNTGDFKKAFLGACEAAAIHDLNFHDLRHTAITRMLEKNISPPLVMKISGHTQSKTFLRYVNQSESSIFEIAMKLDSAAYGEKTFAPNSAPKTGKTSVI